MLPSHAQLNPKKFCKTKIATLVLTLSGLYCFSNQAFAQACSSVSSGANSTISSSCEDLAVSSAGVVTINTGVFVDSNVANATGVDGIIGLGNSGTTTSIVNRGNIYGADGGVVIEGNLGTLTNSGTIGRNAAGDRSYYSALSAGYNNPGSIGALNNLATGLITGQGTGVATWADGSSIGTLNNYGEISSLIRTPAPSNVSSMNVGIGLYNLNYITTLNNFSGGVISGEIGIALEDNISARIDALNNAGVIRGSVYGIYVGDSGTPSALDTITTLTNQGAITGDNYGIYNNNGVITTLNNAQGGNGASATSTALTYSGNLPVNYNIIINSRTHYGQLAVTSGTGTTTFGIYSGGVAGLAASTLNKGTYSSVLSGVTSSNLTGTTSGNYNGFTWSLINSSGSIWDLIVTGASTADTQQSLLNTVSALQNTFTLQNTVLANSFSYDCNVFGANNVCVSAGGRNTAVSAANGLNNTSALLIAAYRVMPSLRVGAYADQNLSVNNAGSIVNLGNNTPLIGLFGAWNECQDGTGTEVKVSMAYGQKNATVTRSLVGTSEAGSGSSQLNSQGVQVTAKYGFGFTPDVVVSPYVGMRYTQNNMGSYTEGASSTVTAPLTYSALNTNATTALAGVGAQYKFIPRATVFAGAGLETDTNTSNGAYSATGIAGLTPINFNANPVKTRPTATVGAYYDVEKNQRLGITGIYRQEPYQAVQTTTVMATYTVGL
ncbi:autotransporter outer membrane beta-barrel domain-containing protein [Polynucleobacter sp. Fuers-14]|uniref:beta strand repeat-containing protein n=1 Tax=Polynucleobacter sp. Fuers-14 TaxID=1758364 RepID=UPI001C0D4632|nr:autotransporter outer membrane beta-barrel domain-containing protein [Polynucleobacter sp. Fuers-14]MBU3641744.1 autotransporter outer membrane beta-barrel domain-containing protein [Polynucleobacter sp. Fuers-14]